MQRNGKQLKTLPAGSRRRLSDARNAWRHMTDEQRAEFLEWLDGVPSALLVEAAARVARGAVGWRARQEAAARVAGSESDGELLRRAGWRARQEAADLACERLGGGA